MKVSHPHIWIQTDPRGIPKAGLLTEWRQTPLGKWEGRVVVLSGNLHNPGEALSICWIDADYLRPANP